MAKQPPIDKVSTTRIKNAIANGSYPIDLNKIADALFDAYKEMKNNKFKQDGPKLERLIELIEKSIDLEAPEKIQEIEEEIQEIFQKLKTNF